ncbi:MAG: HNH endonuclease [Gemmataceae bacterium]|nr:HNH endonuclease [Gemmataceae bacterium]
MAGLRFARLIDQFVADLERQGATVFREGLPTGERPARLRVDDRRYIVLLWTITPGGGPPGTRPATERRIQITKVSGLPLEPDARTLVGGWSRESAVYAFWDSRRHVVFSQKSPSFQVDSRTLDQAGSVGLATQNRPTREGPELVVALRPDFLLWYLQAGTNIHNAPEDADAVAGLIANAEEERAFLDSDPSPPVVARRFDLVQVIRAFRHAQFRPTVLRAYSYRCAVCGIALKLVDAAHIVPVAYPGSTDEVTNGLALCRLHHAAYDTGLLGVFPDYRVAVHPDAPDRLRAVRLAAGLDEFTAALPPVIHLPGNAEARPSPAYLRVALEVRGWPPGAV